jgi:Holliday junction resolvasome RuvABC ATP-dependent DNA helicase subunit
MQVLTSFQMVVALEFYQSQQLRLIVKRKGV